MTETPGKQAGSPPPELEELARRLLDLWQDQLTAVAANPDLATQAARLMAALPLPGMWLSQLGQLGGHAAPETDMTKAWTKMTQDWMAQDWWKGAGDARPKQEPGTPDSRAPESKATAGAAAAAAASGSRSSDLDELSRRLAGIEQRLGELAEQSGKPKSGGSKPKTSARKPRRTRAPDPVGGSGGADGGAAG